MKKMLNSAPFILPPSSFLSRPPRGRASAPDCFRLNEARRREKNEREPQQVCEQEVDDLQPDGREQRRVEKPRAELHEDEEEDRRREAPHPRVAPRLQEREREVDQIA